MTKIQTRPLLSRRAVLKLLAAAGVTTAAGYALVEAAPWLDYEGQANHIRRPLEKAGPMTIPMRELIRYATLAASGHNTQSWQFALKEDIIEIHPNYNRDKSGTEGSKIVSLKSDQTLARRQTNDHLCAKPRIH